LNSVRENLNSAREIDFLAYVKSISQLTNLLLDSTASPLQKLITLKKIYASLNHRKFMKAEASRLIPRKLAANVELLIVASGHYFTFFNQFTSAIFSNSALAA